MEDQRIDLKATAPDPYRGMAAFDRSIECDKLRFAFGATNCFTVTTCGW